MPLEPPTVQNIPEVIPARGIRVKDVILMPPGDDAPVITHDQAIALGRALDSAQPFPVTAVLACATIPGMARTPRPIQNMLVWVVTFTAAEPINVGDGPYLAYSSQPPRPIWVSRHSILFDAQTGEFRLGFFTP